ncbi:MAG TPA: PepSY-associated TM helix domain-containing protein [Terriglobales bacterium]|nr:PepSY-associated TM helix domain-containing protein [Terriglobales bacterium]
MRRVILQLHLLVALVAGIFIVMLGLTGSIMAFEPELGLLQHWKIAHVTPRGTPLSLEQIGDVARTSLPNLFIAGYVLSNRPDLSYQIMTARQLVYIDQYSGRVRGTVKPGMDFLGFVHQLHLRLALLDKGREFGQMTVRWSALAALFLLVSGAYLWWPSKRFGISGGAKTTKFWFDLHNSFGIASLVFVLLLVATGLVISFEEQTTPFLYRISHSQPLQWPRLQVTPPPGSSPITPDQALAIARATVPEATPFLITLPHGIQVYQVFLRCPEDRTPGGRTRIVVDAYRGNILMAVDSRHAPAGYRLVNLNRALHTGDILGLPSKIVVALASLIMPFQLLTGLVMWAKRRRTESKASAVANG